MKDHHEHGSLLEPGYEEVLFEFERQQQEMDEIALFEQQVSARQAYVAKFGNSSSTQEHADMAGLAMHGMGPRLLNARYMDSYSDSQRSAQARHRSKLSGRMLPSLLAARPVTRTEYEKIPKALDAYWKEWNNLEAKNVWGWSTLAERSDVVDWAHNTGTEVHFASCSG